MEVSLVPVEMHVFHISSIIFMTVFDVLMGEAVDFLCNLSELKTVAWRPVPAWICTRTDLVSL